MNKLMLGVLLCALCAPAFAEEPCKGPDCAVKEAQPAAADAAGMKKAKEDRRAQMKKDREAKKAEFKKNQKLVSGLVKEYKSMKPGAKKDAKRAEIAKIVENFHNDQLSFKERELKHFQNRLAKMQERLAQESTPQAKTEWVNQKTERLIESNGDLEAVLKPEPGPQEGPHMKGFPGREKGPHMGKPAPRRK